MSHIEVEKQTDAAAETALLSTEGGQAVPQHQSRRLVMGALATMVMASFVVAWAAGSTGANGMITTHSKAFTGLAEDVFSKETLTLPVILRDFDGNVGDIQIFGEGCVEAYGLVDTTLPDTGIPKLVKKGALLDNQKELDALFTTTDGVNKEYHQTLEFTKDASGVFVCDKPDYFPLNEYKPATQLDVRDDKDHNNYYFSLELRTHFTYHGGEKFTFRGDDDVFVYINNKQVVDLGGCKSPKSQTVDIDSLGLTKGEDYPLALFFAERKCCGSNLRISTSLQLVEPDSGDDGYKCCFFHFIGLPWICFDSKKFPWCSAKEE